MPSIVPQFDINAKIREAEQVLNLPVTTWSTPLSQNGRQLPLNSLMIVLV